MTHDDELIESTEVNVRVAAAQVARRFRGYITFADLAQEGVIWVLRHPKTIQTLQDDGKRGDYRLTARLAKYMERKARAEKASTLQYEPDDEAFYQRGLVETVLPAVWDDEYLVKPPDDPAQAEPHSRKADPAETSNWLVSVIDVRDAWGRAHMSARVRLALSYRYGDGLRISQIAELLEVSDSTVQNYINKGLNDIVNQLGGPAPYRCNGTCECGGIGSRRAISNAEARARTGNDYDA